MCYGVRGLSDGKKGSATQAKCLHSASINQTGRAPVRSARTADEDARFAEPRLDGVDGFAFPKGAQGGWF